MARRRPTQAPASGDTAGLLLPPTLAIYRAEEWPSYRAHWQAKNAWFADHGINPADWNAISPILLRSQRVHAKAPNELPPIDRMRLVDEEQRRGASGPDGSADGEG